MKIRCAWCTADPLYEAYHDTEWGIPVNDDRVLFEFIVLEGAQAGLSWSTILHKREGYREIFKNFDPVQVARMSDAALEKAILNPAIVRNRRKVYSVRQNAKAFCRLQQEFGSFAKYMWSWVQDTPIQNHWSSNVAVPAVTPLATGIAKDLKKRGFSFLGPTIWYAHMQACGMVNDHTVNCFRYKIVQQYKLKRT